jgi:hypothetical protein
LLFFFFYFDNFAAFIMTAVWANPVRQAHFAAIAALHQILGGHSVMRASTITTTRGVLTFWLRGHYLTPVSYSK